MTPELIIAAFLWLLGLCVGSFLNVVVYRLPAGLSIGAPARSFCPACRQPIAWHDNIPLLSWWLLKARCRRCAAPVSVQYPLVEALTGLLFVLVYYLLFTIHARAGIPGPQWPTDWPLLVAWLVLVGSLLACAAMDVVSYMVDVSITCLAVLAGIGLYAIWPSAHHYAPLAASAWTAGAVVALGVSVVRLWLTVWREREPEPMEEPSAVVGTDHVPEGPRAAPPLLAGRLAIVVLTGLAVWLLAETALHESHARDATRLHLPTNVEVVDVDMPRAPGLAPQWVVPTALLTVFAIIVLVGGQRRESDAEVSAAIEQEEPRARLAVLREIAWLAPAVGAGLAAWALVAFWAPAGHVWLVAVQWSPGAGLFPIGGAAVAMAGAVSGACAGWLLRIVFTLIFGREALGVGDIYILAAVGAAAGWEIALLGLVAAVGIALAGFLLSLLLKRSGIIAFGPWLGLGSLTALWLDRPAADTAAFYGRELGDAWSQRPDICLVAGGIMLVGSAVAVVLARLVRQLVDRRATAGRAPGGPAESGTTRPAAVSPQGPPLSTDESPDRIN